MRRSRERKAQVIRARREEQAAWAGCEARAVSQALRAFDLAEYRQMREWLRVNGHILRNAGGRGT